MNYRANERVWQVGDLVLHDADAKRADMLMVVVGYARDGLVRTRYVDDGRRGRVYRNPMAVLHDPARFGVLVPEGSRRVTGPPTEGEREIARLRAQLRQIATAVAGPGGRCRGTRECGSCDLVRTLARVALEGA